MDVRELIAAAKATIVTPEREQELIARLVAAEKRFAEESKRMEVTEEFLNKTYNI